MKERIQYIDLAKGFCIILVAAYHVSRLLHFHQAPVFWDTLSVFRMPLYFFLSGLFFKEYEGFMGFFLRKVNKLLIPFLFFYLVTSFALSNILNLFGVPVPDTESLGISGLWAFIYEKFSNGPIWFLLALFIVNIYFYAILVAVKQIITPPSIVVAIVTLACFGFGFFSTSFVSGNYNLYCFTDTAMSALPFFAIGHLFFRYTDILVPNKFDKFLPIIVVVCFCFTFFVNGKCSYKVNTFTINPILQYVSGMTGTLGIVFLAKLLHDLPFVSYWGRYSIMILVTHSLLIKVYVPIISKFGLPQPLLMVVVLVAVMFSYQLIIPLMLKYLPYVTAQKDVINVSNRTNH